MARFVREAGPAAVTGLVLSLAACSSDDSADGDDDGRGGTANGGGGANGGGTTGGGASGGTTGGGGPNGGGTTGGGGASSGGTSSGGTGGDPPRVPGVHGSSATSLPNGEPVACEHDWTIRMLHYHPSARVPRRMYFSACDTTSAAPTMYTSVTVGHNMPHPTKDATSGALIRSTFDPATGQLVAGVQRHLDECYEVHGIATSDDCSTIGVLCRRPSGSTGADKDVLATHSDADWMTEPVICGDDRLNDEMWLYEWTDGNIQSDPSRYIVHKAIGSWEYGNNYLLLGDDDTYGIAVKATVFGGGTCHEADAFIVMDRSDYTFTNRGWSWACGTGHTIFNRPAYDPTTQKYALICGTDYNEANTGGLGATSFRLEDGDGAEFDFVNVNGLRQKGGPGPLLARPGGGYIGLVVGVDADVTAEDETPLAPPTAIGLVRFGASGDQVGGINWVVEDADTYLSYPQLAHLGGDAYLLGWGEMKRLGDPRDDSDESYRAPWSFNVMEIDSSGNTLTEAQTLDGAGWGEQDQMVSLGDGRVGWAYIANPALDSDGNIPECNVDELQLTVYTSAQ